jgi:3D (Asp-Asp-Asp) domain-containing protein
MSNPKNAWCGVAKTTVYYPLPLKADGGYGEWLRFKSRLGFDRALAVSAKQQRLARIEATAITLDGTVINYDPATKEWTECRFPHGVGNRSNPLIPHRIVAADQSLYPFGSRVTLNVPDGPYGEGDAQPFYIGDTGGAIKGPMRFDIFQLDPKDRIFHGNFWACVEPPAMNVTTPRRMQEALELLGHYKGAIDGKFGPISMAALRAFQKKAPAVPEVEYGVRTGAITTFHLAAAAAEKG